MTKEKPLSEKIHEAMDERLEADNIAKFLHDNYEILAQKTGWQTQLSTRTSFEDLPLKNKKTMRGVAKLVRKYIYKQIELDIKEAVEEWERYEMSFNTDSPRQRLAKFRKIFGRFEE